MAKKPIRPAQGARAALTGLLLLLASSASSAPSAKDLLESCQAFHALVPASGPWAFEVEGKPATSALRLHFELAQPNETPRESQIALASPRDGLSIRREGSPAFDPPSARLQLMLGAVARAPRLVDTLIEACDASLDRTKVSVTLLQNEAPKANDETGGLLTVYRIGKAAPGALVLFLDQQHNFIHRVDCYDDAGSQYSLEVLAFTEPGWQLASARLCEPGRCLLARLEP